MLGLLLIDGPTFHLFDRFGYFGNLVKYVLRFHFYFLVSCILLEDFCLLFLDRLTGITDMGTMITTLKQTESISFNGPMLLTRAMKFKLPPSIVN